MTTLEPAWTRGPYEKQEATVGTPYQPLPVTLPNMMNHVHGARKARRGSGTGCHERAFLPLSSIPPSFSPSLPPSLPHFLLASPPARSFLPPSLPPFVPPTSHRGVRNAVLCACAPSVSDAARGAQSGLLSRRIAARSSAQRRRDERHGLMFYGPRRRPRAGQGRSAAPRRARRPSLSFFGSAPSNMHWHKFIRAAPCIFVIQESMQ